MGHENPSQVSGDEEPVYKSEPLVDLTPERGHDVWLQDKLVAALANDQPSLMYDSDVSKLSEADFSSMKEAIEMDFPKPGEVQDLLGNIRAPIHEEADPQHPTRMFQRISGDNRLEAILARVQRGTIGNRGAVVDTDLASLIARFPDPVAFEREFAHTFLINIEAGSGRQKREEYETSVRQFEQIVYGDQYAVFEQFRLLFAEQMREDSSWNVDVRRELARHHPDDTQDDMRGGRA